ncbi:MAG: hypothetical protein JXO51_02365 [Candidatus Aminicenantes bacterium]|nr:hypothetical protein [Candidatus Aminicenantes bacterium]
MMDFPLERLQPEEDAVHGALGMKPGGRPSARSLELLRRARETFRELARPQGLSRPVTPGEFAAVFRGRGRNAPRTPLEGIFPQARRLHLFAFTLGEPVSEAIRRLFAEGDFAQGAILDAMASLAADNAGRLAEEWAGAQAPRPPGSEPWRAYLYSPGYCGWHISGQEALFALLRPESIGLRLNESFLMTPLKSISGVLAAGPAAMHRIDPVYPFCAQCRSQLCRERERTGQA